MGAGDSPWMAALVSARQMPAAVRLKTVQAPIRFGTGPGVGVEWLQARSGLEAAIAPYPQLIPGKRRTDVSSGNPRSELERVRCLSRRGMGVAPTGKRRVPPTADAIPGVQPNGQRWREGHQCPEATHRPRSVTSEGFPAPAVPAPQAQERSRDSSRGNRQPGFSRGPFRSGF